MAKVVVKNLREKNAGKAAAKRSSIGKKRVVGSEGVSTLRTLDAGSSTFGADFTYVFGKNVEKARRENKLAVGAADVVPTKR